MMSPMPESSTFVKASFVNSLRIQIRVIKALCVRDIMGRFGREGLGFFWLFLEPALFTVGVTAVFALSPTMSHGHGPIPISGFTLTGYSTVMLWRGLTGRLGQAVPSNKGLLYHRNVKVVDLIFSRAIVEIFACTTSLWFLTFVFVGVGLLPTLPVDPLKVLLGWFFYAWFCFATALIFAYLAAGSELFIRLSHVALYLALPFMGGFFMVDWVPASLQRFYLMSPLVNAIELLREGFFGEIIKAHYSISYLIKFNLILTLIGLILTRKIRRQLVET